MLLLSRPLLQLVATHVAAKAVVFGVSFFTRHRYGQLSVTPGGLLPAISGKHGKVLAGWGAGVAGACLFSHACSFSAAALFCYRKS